MNVKRHFLLELFDNRRLVLLFLEEFRFHFEEFSLRSAIDESSTKEKRKQMSNCVLFFSSSFRYIGFGIMFSQSRNFAFRLFGQKSFLVDASCLFFNKKRKKQRFCFLFRFEMNRKKTQNLEFAFRPVEYFSFVQQIVDRFRISI